MTTVTTRTGKVRGICACGRATRAVEPVGGRFPMVDLAPGWRVAPFPPGHRHADGSTGAVFTCPSCAGGCRG